jgi:hypothetical protein
MLSGKYLLTENKMAPQYFLKFSSVKFHENVFCDFELLNPYIWTDGRNFLDSHSAGTHTNLRTMFYVGTT